MHRRAKLKSFFVFNNSHQELCQNKFENLNDEQPESAMIFISLLKYFSKVLPFED